METAWLPGVDDLDFDPLVWSLVGKLISILQEHSSWKLWWLLTWQFVEPGTQTPAPMA